MGMNLRRYSTGDTYLYVYPDEEMTWGVLCELEQDMRWFQEYILDFPRQTSFFLLKEGVEGHIGHGIILT